MKLLKKYWNALRLIRKLKKDIKYSGESAIWSTKAMWESEEKYETTVEYMNKRELENRQEIVQQKEKYWTLSLEYDDLIKRLNERESK